MKSKLSLFGKSIKLVWISAPGWALANIVISLIRGFLPLLLLFLIKGLIDTITGAAQASELALNEVLYTVIFIAIIWFLDEAASDIGNYVRKQQSVKLESYMYSLLHDKASRLDLKYFETPNYYDILARSSREAPWRPNSILNNCVSLFRGVVSLLLMVGVLFSFHWLLVLLLIAVNIPGLWLRLHYADILYNFKREQTPEERKMAYFNWILTGNRPSREVRLFGLGDYFISNFKESFKKTKEKEVDIIRKRSRIDLLSDLLKAVAVFVVFFMIASRTIKGYISLGEMSMGILAFRQGMIYIRDIFGSMSGLYEDYLFVGDTFEFLDLKENIVAIDPVKHIDGLTDGLVIDNLTFSYPQSENPTIKGVSFNIKKGEVVALVGANGAGKSTMVRLLSRLYDADSGSILWDGVDIRHVDPKEYRKWISVVCQDFMLYNMSIGENIRVGDVDRSIDNERIELSAKASGIYDLVNSMPKGFDTVIGTLFDDSRELSWGEWQKIAMSRSLYSDAPLLILDEPSSSLDANTEYEIFSRFREILKGRTAIIISHRFSNITLADKIVVLDKGNVVEMGTHDELIAKEGTYYSMYTKQTSRLR
ncbi:MAG: ABC transporter ATP-binding protein [Bacteroidales bacterium]|nr:ABC transporter ATP-binding protein [Bacteroidales bacterium]